MRVKVEIEVPFTGDCAPGIWTHSKILEGDRVDPADLITVYDQLRHELLLHAEQKGATLTWDYPQKSGPRSKNSSAPFQHCS